MTPLLPFALAGPTGTVLSGPLLLAAAVAVLAGMLSFATPCVLPLVPGFLGYITGLSTEGTDRSGRVRLVSAAVLFVAGFSVVFILMSIVVSSVGLALQTHQDLLLRMGGAVVLLLGALMLWRPEAGWQTSWRPAAGLAAAPLLGMTFGLGFTACSGPALAAIQTLGTSIMPGEGVVQRAVLLALAYCFGLGLPFVLVAAGLGWVTGVSRVVRRHHRAIQVAGGAVLVVLGLLMVSGVWSTIVAWVQTWLTANFATAI